MTEQNISLIIQQNILKLSVFFILSPLSKLLPHARMSSKGSHSLLILGETQTVLGPQLTVSQVLELNYYLRS